MKSRRRIAVTVAVANHDMNKFVSVQLPHKEIWVHGLYIKQLI